MYGSFNPPEGPAKSAQRKDLLLLFFAQDIHRWRIILRLSQCPGSAIPLAAFQVSTDGRFWVSPEAKEAGVSVLGKNSISTPGMPPTQSRVWVSRSVFVGWPLTNSKPSYKATPGTEAKGGPVALGSSGHGNGLALRLY
jgi:hypothetical protein